MTRNFKSAFTLVELLVALGIVAVLSTVVIVTLNPAELMKQARDSNRISDLNTFNTTLGIYAADVVDATTGTSSIVYVSLPDSSPTCANLGLPTLSGGWTYSCATIENYKKIDGTGWIPVNLSRISFETPLSQLPIDPKSSTSTGLYYTFVTAGSWWEFTSILESEKYGPRMVLDGGASENAFEHGTDLTLTPTEALNRGLPPSDTTPTISIIFPTSATEGDAGFTLTVSGTNFTSSSIVEWGGTDKTTTFVSDIQLTATILAADIATFGTVAVTVSDPTNGTSGSNNFAIDERVVFAAGNWTTDSTGGAAQGYGASIAEVAGKFYVLVGGSTTFQKYDPSNTTWTTLAVVPGTVASGGAIVRYNSDTLYATQGGVAVGFYKYVISENTWYPMAVTPSTIGAGGSLAYPGSGDYIYAIQGANSTSFWRYSISGNSWGESGIAQSTGSCVAEANGKLYAVAGASVNFQKYDPSTQLWTNLENIPTSTNSGAAIVRYDSDTLFLMQGGVAGFYKYVISEDNWYAMTSTPNTTGAGGSLAYPGSGDYIYAFRGGNTNTFWRYSVLGNSWATTLANAPSTVYGGGAMVGFSSNILYAFQGGTYVSFWEYNITTGVWTAKTNAPAAIWPGGSLTTDGTSVYATQGSTGVFWKYNVAGNSWSALTSTLATIGGGSSGTAKGGIAYSATLGKAFAISGNSGGAVGSILEYDPVSNAWIKPIYVPAVVNGGGSMVGFSSNILYAFQGGTYVSFWEYNITTGVWTAKTNAPAAIWPGGSLASDGTNVYATGGNSTLFWKYTVATNLWSVLATAPATFGLSNTGYAKGDIEYSTTLNAIFGVTGNSGSIYKNTQ